MNNINIEIQGVRGGQSKTQNIGYALICLRNDSSRILIDDFEGWGASYKKRENELIRIVDNGADLFSGTFEELKEILNKNKQSCQ